MVDNENKDILEENTTSSDISNDYLQTIEAIQKNSVN